MLEKIYNRCKTEGVFTEPSQVNMGFLGLLCENFLHRIVDVFIQVSLKDNIKPNADYLKDNYLLVLDSIMQIVDAIPEDTEESVTTKKDFFKMYRSSQRKLASWVRNFKEPSEKMLNLCMLIGGSKEFTGGDVYLLDKVAAAFVLIGLEIDDYTEDKVIEQFFQKLN